MNGFSNRRSFVRRSGALLLGTLLSPGTTLLASERLQRIEVTRFHMNMLVRITAYVENREKGLQTIREAFRRILRFEKTFSAFDPKSELNLMCANAIQTPIEVSTELFEVLFTAQSLARESRGVFDPTAGPVLELWRMARQTGILPEQKEIEARLEYCGYENMEIDPDGKTVSLLREKMQIDLGAIAKGYIGDRIIHFLKMNGISRAVYHAGGDIVAGSPPPDADGWTVEMPGQSGLRNICNEAMSISGDIYQHLDLEGLRYSHVIDLRTGMALTGSTPRICQAPSGMMADANASLQLIQKTNKKPYSNAT